MSKGRSLFCLREDDGNISGWLISGVVLSNVKQKQNLSSPRYGDLGGDLLMRPHQLLPPHVRGGLLPASHNTPPTQAGHRVDRFADFLILHVVVRLPARTGCLSPGVPPGAQNCHSAPLVSAAKNKPALLPSPITARPAAGPGLPATPPSCFSHSLVPPPHLLPSSSPSLVGGSGQPSLRSAESELRMLVSRC